MDISLSNFGNGDLPVGSAVKWQLLANGNAGAMVVVDSGTITIKTAVVQGTLGVVASLSTKVPDVGTTVTTPTKGPVQITVTAELVSVPTDSSSSVFAPAVPQNSWNATVFPRWVDSAAGPGWNLTVTNTASLQGCLFNNCARSPPPPSPNAACNYAQGIGFPNECNGGDIPCFSAYDCCSICTLDTDCKAAAFENTSGAAGGVCHIKTTLGNATGGPAQNSTAVTIGAGRRVWYPST